MACELDPNFLKSKEKKAGSNKDLLRVTPSEAADIPKRPTRKSTAESGETTEARRNLSQTMFKNLANRI